MDFTATGASNVIECKNEVKHLVSRKVCPNRKDTCLLNDPNQPKLKDSNFVVSYLNTLNRFTKLNRIF